VDASILEKNLPIRAGGKSSDDLGVIWIEPAPSGDETTWRTDENLASDLPAAAHLHSCDYCAWGYFGNESSYVDFYTFAALHIEIPKFGEGVRAVAKSSQGKPVKRKGPSRKGKLKPE